MQSASTLVMGKVNQVQDTMGGLVNQKQTLLGNLIQKKQSALFGFVRQTQGLLGGLVPSKPSASVIPVNRPPPCTRNNGKHQSPPPMSAVFTTAIELPVNNATLHRSVDSNSTAVSV